MKRKRNRNKLYPIQFMIRLTKQQNDHAKALAKHQNVSRAEAIRRAVDAQFVIILSQSSIG